MSGNVELVRGILAEWGRGDMRAGTELFDPGIRFESFMPDANERVVAEGPAEVEAFMREFLRHWREYRLIGEEVREVGEDMVFVSGRQTATGRLSGVDVEHTIYSVWTFRRGRIVGLVFEPDLARALEAAGLAD